MKQIISTVNGWVTEINTFLQGLIVLGVVIGILFDDYFGVIGGIGNLMGTISQRAFVSSLGSKQKQKGEKQ